jgi:hypothetical protein
MSIILYTGLIGDAECFSKGVLAIANALHHMYAALVAKACISCSAIPGCERIPLDAPHEPAWPAICRQALQAMEHSLASSALWLQQASPA